MRRTTEEQRPRTAPYSGYAITRSPERRVTLGAETTPPGAGPGDTVGVSASLHGLG
jgi:hypothetical protein